MRYGSGMRAQPRLGLLILLLGCARLFRPVPVDPDVTFAAHAEHGGLAVDRLPGGGAGRVVAPGWLRWPGAPSFVLREDDRTLARLWLTAPARVEVRSAEAPESEVEPSWDENALRLTLRPASGAPLRTDVFERTAPGTGPPVLSRAAQSVLDVRGAYRAVLRDTKGAPAGWLRVRVGPYQEAPRIYDGVLPDGVSPGLAAATAVALGSEIDWIEDHALNVYRGDAAGPLRESLPLGGSR